MNLFFSLLFRINQDIRDRNLLKKNERILLSLSGGQDSICLILFFLTLRQYWLWDLAFVHCDHGWRTDSRKNASHVLQIAEEYKIPYFQILATKPFNTEEKARNWRYLKIMQIATNHNYDSIVTGHTASDRSETMFMNLNRGSGYPGLHALQWKRFLFQRKKKVQIIRPLLGVQREDLKKIVHEFKLPLWPDTTNQEIKVTRNQLRKQLFPYLRFVFHRNVDKSFAQFAELSHLETLFLDNLTKKIIKKIQRNSSFLDVGSVLLTPIAIQRRLIRFFIKKNTKVLLEFEEIEKIRYLCLNPKSIKSFSLKNKIIVFLNKDKLFYLKK